MRPVLNERSVNFTFYRGIHEFSNSFIFYLEKKVFNFYAAVSISQKILRNGNYNIEFKKTPKIEEFKIAVFLKFYAVVSIHRKLFEMETTT